jgi:hypothetical protein
MITKRGTLGYFFGAALALLLCGASVAQSRELGVDQELTIEELRGLEVAESFHRLSGDEFLGEPELMEAAVLELYSLESAEAVETALASLGRPFARMEDGIVRVRSGEVYVAKKVLEAFPEVSTGRLVEAYAAADPEVRGNLLRAIGRLADQKPIHDLLLTALDDTTPAEPEEIQELGLPMRLCDLAYNQLMLEHRFRGIPRTLGSSHSLTARDLSIQEMKLLLSVR